MAERSVNKAILVGRLGADAETRFTQNGTPVSRVSLAMNRQWTDSDKQVHEETDWMSIVIWNMENLATYLTRGTKLYVEGRLQTRSYDDKEGVKRHVTEVVAENLVLLGGALAQAAPLLRQKPDAGPVFSSAVKLVARYQLRPAHAQSVLELFGPAASRNTLPRS